MIAKKNGKDALADHVCTWQNRTCDLQRCAGFDPQAVFGSIHRTCLSALVTDPAIETWYHSSITLHE